MTRLQKKCLIASLGLHALLMVLLFVGPAFAVKEQKEVLPILQFIPATAVDKALVSGGSPNVTESPAPAPAATEPPPQPPEFQTPPEPPSIVRKTPEPPVGKPKPPKPAKVEPDLTKPVVKDGTEPSKPTRPKKDETEPVETKPKISERKIEPTFDLASPNTAKSITDAKAKAEARAKAEAKARADAEAKARAAQQAFAAQVERLHGQLGSGLSSGTAIEVPGPGGAAFADYRLIVEALYRKAWIPPAELDNDAAAARAKIVIRRDGSVSDARIVKPSGNRAMDRSVERALELKFIAPFPDGAKDAERTFYINFDLKTKRQSG